MNKKVINTELMDAFELEFDDIHGDIIIAGITFSASKVLREMDEIAYYEEFHNWLNNR